MSDKLSDKKEGLRRATGLQQIRWIKLMSQRGVDLKRGRLGFIADGVAVIGIADIRAAYPGLVPDIRLSGDVGWVEQPEQAICWWGRNEDGRGRMGFYTCGRTQLQYALAIQRRLDAQPKVNGKRPGVRITAAGLIRFPSDVAVDDTRYMHYRIGRITAIDTDAPPAELLAPAKRPLISPQHQQDWCAEVEAVSRPGGHLLLDLLITAPPAALSGERVAHELTDPHEPGSKYYLYDVGPGAADRAQQIDLRLTQPHAAPVAARVQMSHLYPGWQETGSIRHGIGRFQIVG